MKNNKKAPIIFFFMAGLLVLTTFAAVSEEIVQARQQRFKQSQEVLQAMLKQYAPEEDYETLQKKARELIQWGDEMPGYFPPDSDLKDDEAHPIIFSEPEGFGIAAQAFSRAAHMLALAAEKQDIDTVNIALKQVDVTCKSCHKKYRIKK